MIWLLLGVKQGPDFKRSEAGPPELKFSDKGKCSVEIIGIVFFNENAH